MGYRLCENYIFSDDIYHERGYPFEVEFGKFPSFPSVYCAGVY